MPDSRVCAVKPDSVDSSVPRFFNTVILFLEGVKKAGIPVGLRFSSESALKSDSSLNSRMCNLEMSCRIETECFIISSSLLLLEEPRFL